MDRLIWSPPHVSALRHGVPAAPLHLHTSSTLEPAREASATAPATPTSPFSDSTAPRHLASHPRSSRLRSALGVCCPWRSACLARFGAAPSGHGELEGSGIWLPRGLRALRRSSAVCRRTGMKPRAVEACLLPAPTAPLPLLARPQPQQLGHAPACQLRCPPRYFLPAALPPSLFPPLTGPARAAHSRHVVPR